MNYSNDEIFKSLVASAFEFLNKAIDEFGTSSKFSSIHFATSIELFLKARLMKEHWSLLIERVDKADQKAFFRGELKTISPDQTIQRLKKIANVHIPETTQEIFLKIAKHRNKMVHFIHDSDYEMDDKHKLTTEIANEQCAGWFAIRQLLKSWKEHFSDWEKDIRDITMKMERHRAFLGEIFKSKQSEIKKHLQDEKEVSDCPSCGFKSVLISKPMGSVYPASCLVCWYSGAEIEIECSEWKCHETVRFNSYHGPPAFFPSCRSPISEEYVKDQLDTGPAITKDNYYDHVDKNCPHCNGYHSVVEHHDWYVCTQCYEISEELGICEFCSEAQLGGVSEHSYLSGCEFCEGTAGRYFDD